MIPGREKLQMTEPSGSPNPLTPIPQPHAGGLGSVHSDWISHARDRAKGAGSRGDSAHRAFSEPPVGWSQRPCHLASRYLRASHSPTWPRHSCHR